MKTILSIFLSAFCWWIQFPDKQGSTEICLSPRAIEQRQKWDIPIDSLDYAVSPAYLDSLRAAGLTIMHTSRWMNGATVTGTQAQINAINGKSWVAAIEQTRDNTPAGSWYSPERLKKLRNEKEAGPIVIPQTNEQLALYNLLPLHRLNYCGQGILLTVCDGGFTNTHSLACFDSIRSRILGHFDLTDDADDFYTGSNGSHGTECFSAIAAIQDGYYGAATGAEYYLMRSEEALTESPKEMDNWVVAVEKCDSLGVNVMSSSLGYFNFDNTSWNLSYSDMNGQNTRSSRAATIAARKGMLVVVAAGNEGIDSWHYISAPADADSILTVGAVDTDGHIASFSSYGPSADGRVKPEVCAVGSGTTLINTRGRIITGDGTSFACPLIAGMAATLWSALPDLDAATIRQLIIESTDRYTSPNSHYGYGIPDAYAAYQAGLELIHSDLIMPEAEPQTEAVKYFHNGKLYILRGNDVYTITGEKTRLLE